MPCRRRQIRETVEEIDLARRIEVRDRFVEDHEGGPGGDRPGEADPLHLAAGELAGQAPGESRIEADHAEDVGYPCRPLGARQVRQVAQGLGEDPPDRVARIDRRERILEHHLHRGAEGPPARPVERGERRAAKPDRSASGSSRPRSRRASVLLPEPLRPIRATHSPSARARSIPARTGRAVFAPPPARIGLAEGLRRQQCRHDVTSFGATSQGVTSFGATSRGMPSCSARWAARRARVAGCTGAANRRAASPVSTMRLLHHRHPVGEAGDDAEIVGHDQQAEGVVADEPGEEVEGMPACATRSRSVVGSSATRKGARERSASAIIARCSMPPDIWNG